MLRREAPNLKRQADPWQGALVRFRLSTTLNSGKDMRPQPELTIPFTPQTPVSKDSKGRHSEALLLFKKLFLFLIFLLFSE